MGLVAVPVYLHVYGETQYGIFLLAFGLIGSLSFFDFGSGKSLIRYTAEYKKKKDVQAFSESLSNSLILIFAATAIIVCIFFIFGIFANIFFKIPEEHLSTARTVFFISALASALQFLDFIPAYMLQGWGVFHRRNLYQLVIIFFQILIIIWVYVAAPSLVLFAGMYCILLLSTLILDIVLVNKEKILANVSVRLRLHKSMYKSDSFSYAKEIFLLSMVGFLSSQADRLILSAITGVASVTIYSIITKPYYVTKNLFANYYSVLQPEFVLASAAEDTSRIRNLLLNSTYIAVAALWILLLCVSVFFNELLTAWIGENVYAEYKIWGCLAMINVCISTVFGSISRYMFVTGKTKTLFQIDVVAASLNTLLSILLTYKFGWYGVVIGTTLQMLIVCFYITRYAKTKYSAGILQHIPVSLLCYFLSTAIVSAGIYFLLQNRQVHWVILFCVQLSILSAAGMYVIRKENFFKNLL